MNRFFAQAFIFFFFSIVHIYAYDLTLNHLVVLGAEKVCFKDVGKLSGEINDPHTQKNWQTKCFMNLPQTEVSITAKELEVYLWQGGFFPQKIIGNKISIKPQHASISWQQLQYNLEKFFPPPQYLVQLKEKNILQVPKELDGKFVLDSTKEFLGSRTLYIQNSFKENIASIPFVLMKKTASYVSTKKISKGQTLTKSNTIKEFAYSDNASTAVELFGYVVQKNISANQNININDVRKPALVPVGSMVKLSYRSNKISFTMYAKTKESGYPGDKIKMQKAGGGRIISAWLTGADTAEFKEELP